MTRAVVAAPLRSERLALRGRLGETPLIRTGQGHRRSTAGRARLEGHEGLLVAGLGGALQPAVRPGDVVVASEVRDVGSDQVSSPSSALLAGALRRCGLNVHVGPIVSTRTLVHGQARRELAAGGALAVDMESVWLGEPFAGRPFAVVRAVVDAPGAPLVSPATIWRGVRGLRSLRRAAPAIEQWAAAVGARDILLASHDPFPMPNSTRKDDSCYSPTNRQSAVRAVAREADIVLVVGSANPSNSRRLVEVAEREGTPAYLVDDANDVDLRWLAGTSTVGITAEASAPSQLVEALIGSLTGLGAVTVRDRHIVDEDVEFTLPRELS